MTAKFAALTLVAVLGWTGSVHAAGTVEAGQAKSATCMACHGMDGNSANPEWPALAGQHASYITKQIKHFKAGERQNPLMAPMAMMLTDQDVEDLAAYFSSQKRVATGETEPSKVKLGQKIYRAGIASKGVPACSGCHSPTGMGIPAQYPRVAGQHAEYTEAQLKAFRDGVRKNSAQMTGVAAKLNDREIKAVADYMAGLN